MRDLNLLPTSSINSIGQIIALVIAIATATRAGWLFIVLFNDERKAQGAPGFMWPFSLYRRTRHSLRAPTYRQAPSLDILPDTIKIGTILKDPDDLSNPLGSIVIPLDATRLPENEHDFRFEVHTPTLRTLTHFLGLFPIPSLSWVENLTTVLHAETVVKIAFQPSVENIKESIGVSKVAKFLELLGHTRMRRVFMVSGLMIGRDCTISIDRLGIFGVIPGKPERIIPRGVLGTEREIFLSGIEDVFLGYQFQVITIGKNGHLTTAGNYIQRLYFRKNIVYIML